MKLSFQSVLLLFLLLLPARIKSQEIYSAYSLTDTVQSNISFSEKIGEVTVTAFRTPYNIFNIPAPVNLITSAQLETGNALTPVEALNQVPGVLMHHGTLSTNRLTIRGIGSRTPYATNKIKAYLGEIPLTGGDGETVLEDLENASIQRIEVIKGPSSSLYGAGLGGTILFHAREIQQDFARYQTTVSSFDTYKNTLSAGIKQEKLDLFLLGSILNSKGFRENNMTNRANLTIRGSYSFNKKLNLETLVSLTKMKGFIPSSIDLETFKNSPQKAAGNWKSMQGYEAYTKGQAGISLNYLTGAHSKISLAAFGNFRDADEPRPFNLLLENSNYVGSRGYFQKTRDSNAAKITFTTGFELFREKYNWSTHTYDTPPKTLSDNREHRTYQNLFAQTESEFRRKIFLSAGININHTLFDYIDNHPADGDKSGKRSYNPVFSPRVGINYKIAHSLSLFGNISHGFSTPTFEETLLPEGTINAEIKPESGWNFETGARANFGSRLQATVSYYRIYIKNLLVARRTGEDAYVGVNAGESLHPGMEAEMKWYVLKPGSYPSLVVNGNVTLANYHFRDFVDGDNNFSGNLLPGTARTTWLLAGDFQPVENIGLRVWNRFVGKMPVNDANSTFSDAYGLANLEAKFKAKAKTLQIEVKSGIQNIFDVNYAGMLLVNAPAAGSAQPRYYYPGNPRNYFFSLLIGWN